LTGGNQAMAFYRESFESGIAGGKGKISDTYTAGKNIQKNHDYAKCGLAL
jgi:hypothetical protein